MQEKKRTTTTMIISRQPSIFSTYSSSPEDDIYEDDDTCYMFDDLYLYDAFENLEDDEEFDEEDSIPEAVGLDDEASQTSSESEGEDDETDYEELPTPEENKRRIAYRYQKGDKVLLLLNRNDPKLQLNQGLFTELFYKRSIGVLRIQRSKYVEPIHVRLVRPYFGRNRGGD